jgi:hypothetical protein
MCQHEWVHELILKAVPRWLGDPSQMRITGSEQQDDVEDKEMLERRRGDQSQGSREESPHAEPGDATAPCVLTSLPSSPVLASSRLDRPARSFFSCCGHGGRCERCPRLSRHLAVRGLRPLVRMTHRRRCRLLTHRRQPSGPHRAPRAYTRARACYGALCGVQRAAERSAQVVGARTRACAGRSGWLSGLCPPGPAILVLEQRAVRDISGRARVLRAVHGPCVGRRLRALRHRQRPSARRERGAEEGADGRGDRQGDSGNPRRTASCTLNFLASSSGRRLNPA